jgi:hypothetical protein
VLLPDPDGPTTVASFLTATGTASAGPPLLPVVMPSPVMIKFEPSVSAPAEARPRES